jgi:D-alanine-D-alanine ligase
MNNNYPFPRVKNITVLYNEVESLPTSDQKAILTEEGAKDDAEKICGSLIKKGYCCDILEVTKDNFESIKDCQCDIFFNLCDGIGNIPHTEGQIPELLDKYKRKYTGSNKTAILLTTNKAKTKEIFTNSGIPTAKYVIYNSIPDHLSNFLQYPVIAKPIAQDCSVGLTSASVINSDDELKVEIDTILSNYHEDALVEEYINGREFNVTMLGNGAGLKVFPVSEIIFGDSYNDSKKPKIIDFDAKWVEDSVNYLETNGKCPADIDEELRKTIVNLSALSFSATGVFDYARVDIRLGKNNTPYFLEVNANPDLYPGMGAAKAAKAGGLSYEDFIEAILISAIKRYTKNTKLS